MERRFAESIVVQIATPPGVRKGPRWGRSAHFVMVPLACKLRKGQHDPMADGDETATRFEELLVPHLDGMLRLAGSMIHDATLAEDLTQEAVLKGLRFFDRFREGTNFKAWIFRILVNTVISHQRRLGRRGREVDLGEESGGALDALGSKDVSTAPHQLSTADEGIYELMDEKVKQALHELPVMHRNALLLAVVEEFKYQEIAEILDCPVGTVMSRLHRARSLMKQRLAQYAHEQGFPSGCGGKE